MHANRNEERYDAGFIGTKATGECRSGACQMRHRTDECGVLPRELTGMNSLCHEPEQRNVDQRIEHRKSGPE